MGSTGVERIMELWEDGLQAADYVVDLITAQDPVQQMMQMRTLRVKAAADRLEDLVFDKIYDISNNKRNG